MIFIWGSLLMAGDGLATRETCWDTTKKIDRDRTIVSEDRHRDMKDEIVFAWDAA